MTDVFSSEKRSEIMRAVRREKTAPERLLRRELHKRGFRFARNASGLPGKPDIVLPKYRVAVFVHGCFWHNHACRLGHLPESNQDFWRSKFLRNRRRDKRVARAVRREGWHVFTIWECALSNIARRDCTVRRLSGLICATLNGHRQSSDDQL